MKDLEITIIQTPLFWEDAARNREAFGQKINALTNTPDIIVLPEMFNTGFSMNVDATAEEEGGTTMHWMADQAAEKNCVITGSLVIRESGSCYNRLVWMEPTGNFYTYDKRHLFRMGSENDHFSGGKERLIVTWKGWRICPLVCYDLRFPVWSRNQPLDGRQEEEHVYDVLMYVANWPQVRRATWSQLLLARAIENQCYVVGLNRIGADGNGVEHSGDSAFISPKGDYLTTVPPAEEVVVTQTLSKSELDAFREKFPVGLDADRFRIED